MKRMNDLGKIKIIANGHGPLLYHNLNILRDCYQSWSIDKLKPKLRLVCSMSQIMAIAIASPMQFLKGCKKRVFMWTFWT